MSRRERRAAARGSQSPAELYQAGLHHMQAGRHLDAQICCKQALAADPNHADALHLMGILCHQMQQYDHALEWISRAIRQNPKPLYLSSLGSTLQSLGRREEALKALDKAVQLKPDDADLWVNLGNILIELARPIDAVLSLQHALTLNPQHWDAANKSGFVFYGLQDFEEALKQFDLCDRLRPNQALTLQARALAFRGLRRFEQSLADNLRSYEIDPNIIETRNNIGDALRSLERHEEALKWFDKALELQPDHIGALNNKAILLGQMHRFDDAFAMYDRMKVLNQSSPATDWNLGLLHMMTGNFEAGWLGREARWKTPDVLPAVYPKFAEPIWLGNEPIDGKTILIRIDEGLGDSIQFARYVPMVAARGARVILVVADAVVPLLSKLPGVSQCLPVTAKTLPPFDMHCPMCSLPLAFGTRLDTIPSGASYLPAPDTACVRAWEDRLGPRTKLRIGLVWSGNSKHGNDHNRSIPLRTLARLLDADATFVSLQKDPRPDDQAVLRERTEILDLTADLTDFVATAALIKCLDLVITVDTSVAHLAGALGCPTWILLPYTPDYRWLLDRDDSPWYPTMRLFRQSETRDYAPVLDRLRSELRALIAANRQRSLLNPIEATATSRDALHETGLRHLQAGQYDQAIEFIARAIRQNPKPEYLASLGITLQRQGRLEEALQTFDKALQLKPDDAGLWMSLGNILWELKRPADAVLSFQQALTLNPGDGDAAYRCGFLLHELGRHEEALFYFNRCDELRPNFPLVLGMRALALQGLKRFDEALADNRRACELDPDNADTCNNIAILLQRLGRDREALSWFDQALHLRPNFAVALLNKTYSLQQLHRFDEAVTIYDHLSLIDPGNTQAEWDSSLLHMLTGDFEAGWAGREARWKKPNPLPYPKFIQPMWLGKDDIDGKTMLLYADEGLGDSLQFARYVPMVVARGARVMLVVDPPAVPLLSAMPGIQHCLPKGVDPPTEFDFHCPMSSLPLAFETRLGTIPPAAPDFPSPPESHVREWEARLGRHEKLRVGLVWSGNPNHSNDRNRSISLGTFARILDADATFVSLQKDPKPEDLAILRGQSDIIDLTADFTDLVETAALISCLDLVITVDTSVAHLAGALGRPTWILLPYLPDYRWLLDRDDSPWYPTARLFRQTETRDYGEVLDRVRSELQALIAAR